MSETTKLLPCPFCGRKPEIERPGSVQASMIIACSNCGARVESGDVMGLTKPSDFRWNRRREPIRKREAAPPGGSSGASQV